MDSEKWVYEEELKLCAKWVTEHELFKEARDAVREIGGPLNKSYPNDSRIKELIERVVEWTNVCYILGFDAGLQSAAYAQLLKIPNEREDGKGD